MQKSIQILGSSALILFAFLAISTTSCKKKCPKGEMNPSCICTEEYAPVCGCDDVTYSNTCHAACAGIDEYSQGECK